MASRQYLKEPLIHHYEIASVTSDNSIYHATKYVLSVCFVNTDHDVVLIFFQ